MPCVANHGHASTQPILESIYTFLNPYIHESALTPHRAMLFLPWTRTVREAVGDRLTRPTRAKPTRLLAPTTCRNY